MRTPLRPCHSSRRESQNGLASLGSLILTAVLFVLFLAMPSAALAQNYTAYIGNASMDEEGANLSFTVRLDDDVTLGDNPITVDWETQAGTATAGSDYTHSSGTVTFNTGEGESGKTINVPILEDSVVEDDETFTVRFTGFTHPDSPGETVTITDTGTGTIDDDDSATVSIAANDAAAAEPANHGQFTVTLTNQSSTATVVNYNVAGTATSGTDYTALTGQVTIPANTSSATIDVTVANDAVLEPDGETVQVTLTGFGAHDPDISLSATVAATVTINDDDSATVSIAANDATAAEPANHGQFTVTLTNQSSTDTVVNYSVAGTATAGTDYTALTGQVTIAANTSSATIDVTVANDAVLEPDGETVVVTLTGIASGDAGISVGAPAAATVTIDDDDSATVSIAANDATAAEPADNGQFTVTLTNQSSTDTVVNYSVAGTATSGTDYTALTGQVTIAANTSSATIDVTVANDAVLEPDGETVVVTLTGIASGHAGLSVGAPAAATVTIDDEDTALLSITANDAAAAEPADDGQFTVSLTNPSSTDTVVNLSLGPSTATIAEDYASFSYQVTIPAGDASAVIDVDVLDDAIVEPTENVTVVLNSVDSGDADIGIDGANDTDTVNIADNDTATVSITANDATAAEPANNGQFTVTLTNQSSTATVVNYSVGGSAGAGTDYTALTGQVTIPADTSSATIDVAVLDDTEVEADGETVEVTLTGFGAHDPEITLSATVAATVTIDDDDNATFTVNDVTQGEAVTPMTFTITLDHPLDIAVVVDVTFTDDTADGGGTDYDSAAQQVTFVAGDTTETVDVAITDDAIVEVDEDFTVSLSSATALGGRPVDFSDTATGTITNNDTATVTVDDVTQAEGVTPMTFTITLDQPLDIDLVVDVTFTDNTATGSGTDYASAAQQVTFVAGDTTETVDVAITSDTLVETTEDFTVALSTATALDGRPANFLDTATGTINDDDSATLSIAANDAAAAEPADNGQFTVTLTNPSSTDTVVNYGVGGTATAGTDYTALSGQVTIPAGDTSAVIDVTVLDDTVVEADGETVDVTLTGFGAHDPEITLSATVAATVTVDDDDTATFTINNQTVNEATGNLTFTVSLNHPLDVNVIVDVGYTDGTADGGGVDYDSAADQVTFAAGDTADKTVDVAINNDAIVEPNETFTATLSVNAGTVLGSRAARVTCNDDGTGTISDNDYNLSLLVNPAGSGCTIDHVPTGTDCGAVCDSYNLGVEVTLSPEPAPGYAFTHWTGALSGVSYPQTVIMDADKTVTANFETTEDCFPVVNQKTDGTAWTSLGEYGFCGAAGEKITLTHGGDGSISFDAIRFVRLSDSAETIVDDGAATYGPNAGWNANACGDCVGGTQHETDTAGDTVTVDVAGLGLNGTYDVQVRWKAGSDRDETAHYCVIGYGTCGSGGHPITATKGPNGTMSYTVDGGAAKDVDTGTTRFWVDTGANVVFTFTADGPSPQYVIEYVAVDGDSVAGYVGQNKQGPETYPFPAVASAHDIEVSFNRDDQETTETCFSVDQLQDGSSWYYLGTFEFWSGTGGSVVLSHQGDGSVSLDAIRWEPASGGADIVIDDEDPECVYDESGATDWYRQDCAGCYEDYHHYTDAQGDQVTVTPDLPAAGVYNIYVRWHTNPYRDTTASYCVRGHQGQVILAEAGPNGVMVDESGVTVESGTTKVFTVISGSTKTFTAYANEGYGVEELIVDGESLSVASGVTTYEYTFGNILTSHSIVALFEDHGFSCESATPLTCGSGVTGEISPTGDVDYFEVELAGSGLYTFYTAGDTDTYGTLLDSFCSPMTTDDDSGGNANFSIYESLDPGTYYVAVEGKSGTTGEYGVHMVCEHVIRSSAGTGGRIDPAGNVIVAHNSGTTFAITPNSGVSIVDVVVDGSSVGPVDTYAFDNVTENHTIEAVFSFVPTSCAEISDVPLDALTAGVGALIMFVLDDSGSMDWEFMTREGDGLFMNEYFVFDNPGDNLYSNDRILSGGDRGRWKSQWKGYNRIYYNPGTVYETWPTLPNADPDTPRSHPYHATPTLNMDTTYYSVAQGHVVNNDGVYVYSSGDWYVNDDGTGGEFTCTKDRWRRSSGLNWFGNDTTRSVYANQTGVTASWTPDLPADGEYEVYVWYTTSGTRDADAPYQVVHDGGSEYGLLSNNYSVDQRYNGGSWVQLGNGPFTFSMAGTFRGPSGVTLTRYNDGQDALRADGQAGNEPNTAAGDDWDDHYDSTCADAVAFVPSGGGMINIPNSHYYTLYDLDGDGEVDTNETVYLVILNGATSSIDYYEAAVSDDVVGDGDLTPVDVADVPDAVRPRNANGSFRTYAEERQNFANWYSFYRRRELTAIAAISRTIYDLEGVYVGFSSINGKIKQPVLPVNVDGEDRRSDLLTTLYSYVGSAYGTPLRRGLQDAGEYFDQQDGSSGGLGFTSPWAAQDDGGECQQAFTIVMTDGYWNGESPYVGNVDGTKGAPYADSYWNTLADVAMYYYDRDLVDGLEDMVPTNAFDDNDRQHLVTYTVSFGVSGTLNPDDYDLSSGSTNYPTWPSPTSSSQAKIDDLWHAGVNGRGDYLNAGDPDELIDALTAIMQNIAARTGSAASVSINGDQLFGILGDDVRIFQARYSSGTMTGDVVSFALDQETGDVLADAPVWSAADLLDARVDYYGHTNRLIITKSLAAGGGGIPFRYTDLSTSGTTMQMDDLTPDWSASAAASPENLINYLRGDQTHELDNGGPFRDRSSRLGDIVNSSPLYHQGLLYVGGNDGMLHALDAATGQELFGYVPGLVYDHLKRYADPDYGHLFYVDQTPYAADHVDISGTDKTVLICGLGKGGKGYFALDITDFSGATSFASMSETTLADRALWEFPNASSTQDEIDDMGYSYSRAYVYGSNDTTNAPEIVVFGNGYNSENSSAVLFILDPASGDLLHRIDTGVTNCNGLSSPGLFDADFDGDVDYIYAGDLQGNLWKFDLTSNDYTQWGVAYGEDNDLDGSINAMDGDDPAPVFQAQGPGGTVQPITVEPDFLFHCDDSKTGMLVVFGTGKYLGESDITDTTTQAVYGIWDYGDDSQDDEYLGTFQIGYSPQLSNQPASVTLLEQTVVDYVMDIDVDTDGDGTLDDTEEMKLRVLSSHTPDWSVTTTPDGGTSCGDFPSSSIPCDIDCAGCAADPIAHAGWYFLLPSSGERVVGNPLVRLSVLNYVTFTPEDSPCGGEGYSFPSFADPCTGGNLGIPFIDINRDGVIDEQDLINVGTESDPIWVAPSAKMYSGRLQPPAIVRMPGAYGSGRDLYYFSSSLGAAGGGAGVETEKTKGAKQGIIYWKDLLN